MSEPSCQNSFQKGLRDGIPIGLGYLSVAFTFGMMAVAAGIPALYAILISMTNLTSAGQFAGLNMIVAASGYLEIALTQLVINIRYSLMSLSLSQKLDKALKTPARLGVSFGITDEIFAVSSTQPGRVGATYMRGLLTIPYFGWTLGTVLGALAGTFLPPMMQSALGIAIYGMFLAIIVPAAKKSLPVFLVTIAAITLSCLFRFVPGLQEISGGFVIIICSVAAAGIGAVCYPKKEELS